MNKIFKRTIAVLTLMCTFILCSCNHSTQNEPTSSSEDNEVQTTEKVTEPPTTMPDSELNLMQKVLLAREDVIDVEDGQAKKIHQLQYFRNGTSFYYVDLDKDGKNEVILEFADWSILHEIDGKIYRYKLPYSAIVPMFKDGTMYSSSTASEWFLWRIAEFGEKDIVSEYIYYAVCDKDAVTQYYSFNGIYGEEELLTDEELELIRNQYKEEKARKYTLGSVDILNIVSDYE